MIGPARCVWTPPRSDEIARSDLERACAAAIDWRNVQVKASVDRADWLYSDNDSPFAPSRPTEMSEQQHLSLRMRLAIPAHEYLAYYRSQADAVLARTLDGRSIEFPAIALRRHVSRDGVYGLFEIEFDADHRLVRLERIGN